MDVGLGPAAVADGLEQAAATLGVDLLAFVDVGGDVLGTGTEPGLASPLCDAVMLAAAALLQQRGLRVLAAVFGPCCDGELTPEELLGQLALLAADRGLLGVDAITPEMADELERAVREVPTEASAQALRCARGELGVGTIRAGRRTVPLSPLGATTVYFDAHRAVGTVARLARMVLEARDLDHAHELLQRRRRAHRAGLRARAQPAVGSVSCPGSRPRRSPSPPGTSRPRPTTRSPCSRTSRSTAPTSSSCSRACPGT